MNWSEKNSGNYKYVDNKNQNINPANKCKINKQIQLQSNIFNEDNLQPINENVELINQRIETGKRINKSGEKPNVRKTRDLKNNDRLLWGAVHSKWEKTNIDWRNTETELMFKRTLTENFNDDNEPKEQTAFQRKINQLADTKNTDTITESTKVPIKDLQRPINAEEYNEELRRERIEKLIQDIPNLNENQKKEIRMKSTAINLDDADWDNKAKTLTNFYNNPLKKEKKENPIIKIGQKQENLYQKKNINDYNYHDYVITYPTKGGDFEKFDEGDIKKMLGAKGLHIYEIQKNQFDNGKYNTIKFKVRENEGENVLEGKLNEFKDDLNKQNFKIKIEKEKKKDIKKNQKRFVGNPGGKVGIMADPESNNTKLFKKKEVKLKH